MNPIRSSAAAAVLVAACALAGTPLTAAGADPGGARAAAAGPTISGLSIARVNEAEVTTATISGARFQSGLEVSFGHGVRSAVLSVTATTIAVRLTVKSFATYGMHTLTVTNPGGASASLRRALHVGHEAVLAKWAVGQGAVDWSTSLVRPTFKTTPTVAVSGSGVAVASATIGAGGTLDVAFSVARHAAVTPRTLTLTQGSSTWHVQNGVRIRPAPTVVSVTPLGQNTSSQGVKVRGSHFEVCSGTKPTISISGSGVTVDSVSVALGTLMYATLTVSPTAPLGLRDVTVTNCDSGGTATSKHAFSVLGAPVVSHVDSLALGVTRTEAIAGSGLTPTTTFKASGTGITIDHVQYISPMRMRATITVSATAAVGPHDVTATDSGGASSVGPGVFTVDPLPTETTASPGGIGANTSVELTVHGTGFRRKAEIVLGDHAGVDPELSIGATSYVSATELQARIIAPSGTLLRTDTISVVNLDGGVVATLHFHTNPGPVLTLTSSTTTVGSVDESFTAPAGAPASEHYTLRICTNAALTKGCVTKSAPKKGSVVGLKAGSRYWAVVTAPAGTGFYAAQSLVVGPRLATSQLGVPTQVRAVPSTTRAGALQVTFAKSAGAPATQRYTATACTNRAMTTGCVSRAGVTSGAQLTGLVAGTEYFVTVTALASPGYLAATSSVSPSARATVQLGPPVITKATLRSHVLTVDFNGASHASATQSYTLTACSNAAMTKGCVTRQYYRSGRGIAGFTQSTLYVRLVAVSSPGFLAAASSVVKV